MSLYVGRESETSDFMRLRRKRTASLVVCQGRRRIGKSTFIAQCARQFDHVLAFDGLPPRDGIGKQDQLAAFAEQLARQTALPKLKLDSWPQAFQLLSGALPPTGWTVLLLDEISWMAIGDRDFAGHLKAAWDRDFSRRSRLVVVLCGSVSSWIQKNILNSTGFVGRCSREFLLAPLTLPSCNAFWRGKRVSASDKLKVLAVTGGVPLYLEQVDPGESAEQNIQRLCFEPGGLLVREFDQIFHDTFGRRAATYREIVRALANGRRTVSEIGRALKHGRGGTLSRSLEELQQAGFVHQDVSFDLSTGNDQPRAIRYRLSDNYLRFYLKYVEPIRPQIDKGLYQGAPLESLLAWDTIIGLQFENLVLSSLDAIRRLARLDRVRVLNAGPYAQSKTQRREGCQVDLLVRTKRAVYVFEVKLRSKITRSVIGEVQQKVDRLRVSRGLSVRTGLIYEGELQPGVEAEDFFDVLIPFGRLLEPDRPAR